MRRPPPAINDTVLHICLQYEYFKNKDFRAEFPLFDEDDDSEVVDVQEENFTEELKYSHTLEAFKNVSELMMNLDKMQQKWIEVKMEMDMEKSKVTEKEKEPEIRKKKTKRRLRTPSDSMDTDDEVLGPCSKKRKLPDPFPDPQLVIPKDTEDIIEVATVTKFKSMNYDSDDDEPGGKEPFKDDGDSLNFYRNNVEKEGEEVIGIEFLTVYYLFEKFDKKDFEMKWWLITKMTRHRLIVNNLMMIGHHMRHRRGDPTFTTVFNEFKVIIDFDRIKFHLRDPEHNARFEYWKAVNGCLIWHFNSVKYVKEFTYETLAANEFFTIISKPIDYRWERVEFDYEERTNWDPMEEYHRPFFLYKIKKFMFRHPRIESNEFKMTVYKNGNKRSQPFKLRFFVPVILKKITLRVWDDDHIAKRHQRRFIGPPITNMLITNQWRHARILDIGDMNMKWLMEGIIHFDEVHVYWMGLKEINEMRMRVMDYIREMRENFNEEYLHHTFTIHTKMPIPLRGFRMMYDQYRASVGPNSGINFRLVNNEGNKYEFICRHTDTFMTMDLDFHKYVLNHTLVMAKNTKSEILEKIAYKMNINNFAPFAAPSAPL